MTGRAGFIGSNYVNTIRAESDEAVVLDTLAYVGNPANLASHHFPEKLMTVQWYRETGVGSKK